MIMRLKLAIVGAGFVGKAVDFGFDKKVKKCIIDPKLGTSIELLNKFEPDVTFVCVPTPMNNNGAIDSSIVEEVVRYLISNTSGIIVLKSTVTPSIIRKIVDRFGSDRFVYNPEFLTEKAANEDFVNPKLHVFGGNRNFTDELEQMYKKYSSCKPCVSFHMSAEEASFVKYGMNTFLASKVLWFNQFYDILEKFDCNYNTVVSAITADPRVGSSHTSVPGFDRRRGFSGSCFPKDSAAFVMFARDQEIPFTVLEEVVRQNQMYRNNQGGLLPREIEQNVRFDFDI
jgi:nucleotide sugar dehydrogenase